MYMYEKNPCFLFIYDNSYEQLSLVLETRNIVIGVQDKNIKIRFCVVKIQKVSGIIIYGWIA